MSDRAKSRRTGPRRQRGELKRFGDRWKIRLRSEPDANGKRRQQWHDIGPVREFPTKEAASNAAQPMRDQLAPARVTVGITMPWPAACRLYEARDLAELAEGTQRNYRQVTREYLEPAFRTKYVHEITTRLVQEWIWARAAAARCKKLRPIKPLVGLLLTILGRLALHGVAVCRPDRALLRFPRDRSIPRTLKSRSFTSTQMDQLLEGAQRTRDRALLGLLRYLGLRISEAAGLTTDAIDLDAAQPTLSIMQAAPRGKVSQTKTARARRTLAIPPPLVELLRAWLAELATTPEKFLFPGRAPGRTWHTDAIRRRLLVPLRTKFGLPALGFHGLRHGSAYLLVGAGNLADAARILGHKDASMTSAYAEATDAGMRHSILVAAGKAAPFDEVGKTTPKSQTI